MATTAKVQAGEDYFTVSPDLSDGWTIKGKNGECQYVIGSRLDALIQCDHLNRAYAPGKAAAGGGAREQRRIRIELLRHFDGMRPDDITEAQLDAVEAILRREGA